jgi:protein-tyrosine phosphatase
VIRVCFVCLGNICRSPTAAGVMRRLVADAGLADHIEVDSAGTGDYHVGQRPDARSLAAARARGIELPGRARQFEALDFERFDYVLAADRHNLADLRELASGRDTRHVALLRSFDPAAPPGAEVPDPYHGGARGFDEVLDLCEAACRGVLEQIVQSHGLRRGTE